jgi:hypothetical protein
MHSCATNPPIAAPTPSTLWNDFFAAPGIGISARDQPPLRNGS